MNDETNIGILMHELMAKAFPICRSITGDGVRETLKIMSELVPLTLQEVPTGTVAFDWVVPKEWNIRDAYVADENGNKVVDFKKNNLHVVGYSVPVDKRITLSELQDHLYSLPEQPNAIPYVTSYYKERWGFCISHNERMELKEGKYHAFIDSTLKPGNLAYGECILKGETSQEVFLSTYVCHPSMANNELSGPVVTAFIAKWLASRPRKYTYRIIFIPETIGSITYLSRNLDTLKKNVIAGFNISCIGDDRAYSYVASRYANTLADRVAANVLAHKHPDFIKYSYLDRGSDERQYCSPGVDLPVVMLCRSKGGEYPEYHTSLDNLDFVTPGGLLGGYGFVKDCIKALENNRVYRVTCYAEPQLGKRGLYPNLSTKHSGAAVQTMMDFIAYADGTNDLLQISNYIKKPVWEIIPIAEKLLEAGLIIEIEEEISG
jgi:aminopeptidase-like protein